MQNPLVLALVSGLLGGVAGGTSVFFFAGQDETPARARAEGRPQAFQSDQADEAGADETKERLRKLEHRLALVTAALQKSEDAKFMAGDEDSLRADGDGVDAGEEGTDVADPVFEAAVLDIMDREQERKEEERTTWRKKLHNERGQRYAGELTSTLSLSEQQQSEIAQVVVDYFEEMRALRDEDSPERPSTRKEWREFREKMNQGADEKLRSILGPDQFAKYEALDPEEKLGWRRSSGGNRDNQRSRD